VVEDQFVAFDVETTGLSPEGCRLTEIAGIRFRLDGTIEGRFEELTNPGSEIPEEVRLLTGITDRMVAHAAPPIDVVERFMEFAEGAVWVAHNALFDGSFLAAELERHGRAVPDVRVVDTLNWARARLKIHDFRLEMVARYFSLRVRGVHRAAVDARTAMKVFLELSREAGAVGFDAVMAQAAPFPLRLCVPGPARLPEELYPLLQFIIARERVTLEYEGGTHRSPRPITPTGLTCVGAVSYLIAYCHRDKREKQFRLDRIRAVRQEGVPAVERSGSGRAHPAPAA
jgi:DNA polymerase III epsilon subunit family exonuclease